jgi:hypothetical protein
MYIIFSVFVFCSNNAISWMLNLFQPKQHTTVYKCSMRSLMIPNYFLNMHGKKLILILSRCITKFKYPEKYKIVWFGKESTAASAAGAPAHPRGMCGLTGLPAARACSPALRRPEVEEKCWIFLEKSCYNYFEKVGFNVFSKINVWNIFFQKCWFNFLWILV